MSLPADLLEQARHLAHRERRKPRQASLRRAVSATYYALFHLLVEEAIQLLVGQRTSLQPLLRRSFSHTEMKKVAAGFKARNPNELVKKALGEGVAISEALAKIAATFGELQQYRHLADYDLSRQFTRGEVEVVVRQGEEAVVLWQAVRKSLEAQVFLVALAGFDKPKA